MTKQTEALKMAIEYIDKLKSTGQTNWLEINVIQNACKEALEQPKEKKYLYVYHENGRPLHIVPYYFANHIGYDYIGKIEVQND